MAEQVEVEFGARVAGLEKGIQDAVGAVRGGTVQIGNLISGLASIADNIAGSFAKMGSVVGAALLGAGLMSTVSHAMELGESLAKASEKTGIAVEEISRLRYAAKLADVEFKSLETGLTRFSRSIQEALTNPTGEAAKAFEQLGIKQEFLRSNSNNTRAILLAVADAYSRYADGSSKATNAITLFSRAGAEWIPLLNEGSTGLNKLGAESDRLNQTMSATSAKALREAADETKKLSLAMEGLWVVIATNVVPVVTHLAEALTTLFSRAENKQLVLLEGEAKRLEAEITRLKGTIEDGNWFSKMTAGPALADAEKKLAAIKAQIDALKTSMKVESTETGESKPEMPGGAADKQFAQWKTAFQEMLIEQRNFYGNTTQLEIDYWNEKLAVVERGSDDYKAITARLFELQKGQAQEALRVEIEVLRTQQDAAKDNFQERLRLQEQLIAKIAATEGELSISYFAALRERERMTREYYDKVREMSASSVEHRRAMQQTQFDIEKNTVDFQREMGILSEREAIQAKDRIAEAEYQAELQKLQRLRDLDQTTVQEKMRLDQQIDLLNQQRRVQMLQAEQQQAIAVRNTWMMVFSGITNAVSTSVKGIIMGTTTMRQALANFAIAVVASFADMGVQMLAKWIATQIGMTAVTATEATARSAAEAAAAATTIATTQATAVAEVMAQAAAGAAAAMASVAAIPFIGWAMAPGVGAAHYAMAMSYAPLAFAEKGFGEVPDDMLTMLHKEEMVLPADLAGPLRDQLRGGGTGGRGGDTYYISAVDAYSLRRMLRRNPSALSGGLEAGKRNFVKGRHV